MRAGAILVGTCLIGLALAALPVAAARGGGSSVTAAGSRFDPLQLPRAGRLTQPTQRERQNARALEAHRSTKVDGRSVAPARGRIVTQMTTATAVTAGIFAMRNASLGGADQAPDPAIAILGSTMFGASSERLFAATPLTTDTEKMAWTLYDFFAVPITEFYWGARVVASEYKGRYVAVLPTFEGPSASCAHGWLNVAISSSADPTKPWTRYRISIGDAWTDEIHLGVSDDKIVLATNQWDLDTLATNCLASAWEGARVRVIDWADALDGGTLTVRDVTPASATSYFGWVPVTNIATTAGGAAGTYAYLVGEKQVNGSWGYFTLAAISGDAKAGTAAMVRNEDLTTAGTVPQLFGPPASIAAFASGNGGQDERIIAATLRAGRLWVSATTTCKLQADTAFRACARYTLLNIAATPAVPLDDVDITDVGRDTFLPLVGFSHDGGAYFLMSGSSALAQAPIDTYAMYRAPGQTITGGADEVRIHAGEHNYPGTYFGDTGSVVPDPADAVGAWLGGPATTPNPYGTAITRLRGGQTAPPTGSFYLWLNNGWVNGPFEEATFLPDPSSPIQRVRWSAVADVEATAGGPHLIHGQDSDSLATWGIDTGDPAIGVQPDPTHVQLYVQWQTQDGTWSTPVLETYQVDAVRPVLNWSPRISFTSGTAGTTAPARITWSATDDASGILKFLLQKQWSKPGGPLSTTLQYFPATTTYANFSATLSDHYTFQVMAFDRAGNNDDVEFLPASTFAAIQSGTALHYYKTWSTASSSNYLGGSTRYQSSLGAYVSYTFTGQAIAFVSTKGPTRGKFEVYIDGVKKATVDLYAAGTHYRQVVYQTSWASPGTHTIKIRVLGTSGRPRVDFDGFLRAT